MDLDGFEDPFDARTLPALDREDFDGLAIGIPPFLIVSLKVERHTLTLLLTADTIALAKSRKPDDLRRSAGTLNGEASAITRRQRVDNI
ncbi:hypothetical protein GCM10008097_29320 [Mycetocola manganoxydans]|nr:hypothetical protein GCM10008097_29320 [Mycetocola manganoxydans]